MTYTVFADIMKELHESNDYDPTEWEKCSTIYTAYFLYQHYAIPFCEKTIKTKETKELLEMVKNVQFDRTGFYSTGRYYVSILIWIMGDNFQIAKGKPPVVSYIPFGFAPWLNYYIGGPHYPTVRSYVHSAIAKPEGLWQKTWNALYYIADDLIQNYYYMPISQRIAERYLNHEIRPLQELEKNITIVLINTHSTFELGISLPPNAIEIGGLHAQMVQSTSDEKAVTYPDSIREFIDGAKNGAIVISLGTNVNWKPIGLDKLKAVTQALSKLKQRVLWKLDIELPFEVPNNVMVIKWMPQNEILTHKNVKAIWTHGGLLNTQEAIWQGVPVIGMPFFMD